MLEILKNYIKTIPGIVILKRKIFNFLDLNDKENPIFGNSKLNVLNTFPSYTPNSSGKYSEKAVITLETINELPTSLNCFLENLYSNSKIHDDTLENPELFAEEKNITEISKELSDLFNKYGSDKSSKHDYHFFYAYFLRDKKEIKNIVEIGLGTNNVDVVSNMGINGKPGASLRAFKDFCPNANIYGGDIDERILFNEDRISTFFVNQTCQKSLNEFKKKLPNEIDLFIDDGLHSPHANINTLAIAITLIKKGGWILIEDIGNDKLQIWKTIKFLMEINNFNCHFFRRKNLRGFVFAANKKY